jgi:hypothetical protein
VGLNKSWHIVLRFAIAGFLMAELATLSFVFKAPNVVTNLMTLASPGMWLFPHVPWGGAHREWFLFAILPIANAAAYAILGVAVVALITKLRN